MIISGFHILCALPRFQTFYKGRLLPYKGSKHCSPTQAWEETRIRVQSRSSLLKRCLRRKVEGSRDEVGMHDSASSHSEPIVCSLCPTQKEPTACPLDSPESWTYSLAPGNAGCVFPRECCLIILSKLCWPWSGTLASQMRRLPCYFLLPP